MLSYSLLLGTKICRRGLRGRDRIYIYIYGIWIYIYPCNQCISPLMLCVRISIRARCTTLCDKVCQWLATDRWFFPSPPVSSSNKTDRHDITEILLKWIFVLSSITGISSSVISVLSHKSLHTIHIVTLDWFNLSPIM